MAKVTIITKDNIEETIKVGTVVIQFSASWCGPCRQLTPIMEQLSTDFNNKAVFGKVDIDNDQELATKYGIRSVPTTIIFKDGKVVDTITGVEAATTLTSKIDGFL